MARGFIGKPGQPFIPIGRIIPPVAQPPKPKPVKIATGPVLFVEGVFPTPIQSPFILWGGVFTYCIAVKGVIAATIVSIQQCYVQCRGKAHDTSGNNRNSFRKGVGHFAKQRHIAIGIVEVEPAIRIGIARKVKLIIRRGITL